jgi:hypothetical protein
MHIRCPQAGGGGGQRCTSTLMTSDYIPIPVACFLVLGIAGGCLSAVSTAWSPDAPAVATPDPTPRLRAFQLQSKINKLHQKVGAQVNLEKRMDRLFRSKTKFRTPSTINSIVEKRIGGLTRDIDAAIHPLRQLSSAWAWLVDCVTPVLKVYAECLTQAAFLVISYLVDSGFNLADTTTTATLLAAYAASCVVVGISYTYFVQ